MVAAIDLLAAPAAARQQHPDAALFARDRAADKRYAALLFPAAAAATTVFFEALSERRQPWLGYEDRQALGVAESGQGGRTEMTQRLFTLSDLPAVLEHCRGRADHYLSQSSFRWPQRRAAAVAGLTSCWLDLDFYRHHLRLAQVVPGVQGLCEAWELPPPTQVVSSGRGLYLKWLFKGFLPGAARPRWAHVQRRLVEIFRPLGADPAAVDAARVFRVVGSMNGTNGREVRLLDEGRRIDFEALAHVLPRTRLSQTDRQAVLQLRQQWEGATARTAPSERRGGGWLAGVETDLVRLAGMRGSAMEGCRELAVFIIMNSRRGRGLINDAPGFWRQVAEVARLISGDSHFLDSLTSSFRGGEDAPFYRYRRDTLMARLGITSDELEHLPTLRAGSTRVSSREHARAQRSTARDRARAMRAAGTSYAAIAGELGITRRTAADWCKRDTDAA